MANIRNFKNKLRIMLRSAVMMTVFCLLLNITCFSQDRCNMKGLPSISFPSNSTHLIDVAKSMLQSVSGQLKDNPFCSVLLMGYPTASKSGQMLSDKRLTAIKTFLVEKEGISADRIIFNMQFGGGDPNTVDIKPQ